MILKKRYFFYYFLIMMCLILLQLGKYGFDFHLLLILPVIIVMSYFAISGIIFWSAFWTLLALSVYSYRKMLTQQEVKAKIILIVIILSVALIISLHYLVYDFAHMRIL